MAPGTIYGHREKRWRRNQPKGGRWTRNCCGCDEWRESLLLAESTFSFSPKWPTPLRNVVVNRFTTEFGKWDNLMAELSPLFGTARDPGCWRSWRRDEVLTPRLVPRPSCSGTGSASSNLAPPGGWDAEVCRHPPLSRLPAWWHLVFNLWS